MNKITDEEKKILKEADWFQDTHRSLMELGFCWISIISITELIAAGDLCTIQCIEWLNENRWMLQEVPVVVKQEIEDLLGLEPD